MQALENQTPEAMNRRNRMSSVTPPHPVDSRANHLTSVSQLKQLALMLALLLTFSLSVFGMSASPHDIHEFQPDGTPVVFNIRGGVNFHWLEDSAGYTVVQDGKEFVYARLDARGRLAPTALLVGKANPGASGLQPQTLPSLDVRQQLQAERLPGITNRGPVRAVTPLGTVKNVVILMRFANHTSRVLPSVADMDTIFNAAAPVPILAPTGSVRDLYLENSYGAMTLNSTVYAWVTLPQTEAYYANGQSGDSTVWQAITSALNLT